MAKLSLLTITSETFLKFLSGDTSLRDEPRPLLSSEINQDA